MDKASRAGHRQTESVECIIALDEKDEQFSDEESEQWAKAEAFVGDIEGLIDALSSAAGEIPEPDASVVVDADQPLHRLFAQRPPVLDTTAVAHADILAQWNGLIRRVLGDIEAARQTIVAAVERLQRDSGSARGAWKEAKQAHDRTVTERLKKAGFVSPSELINRVAELRSQINTLEKVTKPRLIEVQELVSQAEVNRDKLFTDLEELDAAISTKRQQKAHDLTEAVGDHVQVHVEPFANREAYLATLDRLARSSDRRIQNRNAQLRAITEKIRPIELVRTLAQGGCLPRRRGLVTRLDRLCGITEHTQNVLCGMAKNAQLIAELATVQVPDVPRIRVQRRGEKTFADIRTGLSPGEQSAAILTLALQTRTAPLILDQPEDELGYSYVVHLIVPKILQAKFARQILVVTHNANIPVLGDADLVIKMENYPLSENDRRCVPTACGCFESPDVTAALLELEGGAQAFQYRQHRYAITGTKA